MNGQTSSSSTLPAQTWVLRWNVDGGKPTVETSTNAPPEMLEVFETAQGNLVVFDGYLFDLPKDRRHPGAAAQRVAEVFEARGDDFLQDLRGGFYAAIWDRKNNRVLAGRDGMGVYAAYYFWNGRQLLVSSSVDALLTQPEPSGKPNIERITEFLSSTLLSQHLQETFYADIQRLPPAHRLIVGSSGKTVTRYWNPVPVGFSWATDDELEQFEATLRQAVERCIDVGAQAIAMSGGFDSVGIAAIAADIQGPHAPLSALSVRFPNTEINEEATQAQVAKVLGMPQYFRTVNPAALDEDFVAMSLANSAGNSSPVMGLWQGLYSTLFVTAQEQGLHRVLFGTGGDEMLVVDTRYAHDLFVQGDAKGLLEFIRAWQKTSPFPAWRVAHFLLWESVIKPTVISQARNVAGPTLSRWYHSVRSVVRPMEMPIRGRPLVRLQERVRESARVELGPKEGRYVAAIRELPQTPTLSIELEQGLEWAGRYGVRILYPFFDQDFVTLALRTPPRRLYQGGRMKGPLRELVYKKLPSVTMPVRKVDFTHLGRDVLRRFGRNSWNRLGGATRLAELGIIDPVAANDIMEHFFSGRSERWVPVWQLLSTEAWLAARFARS